MAMTAKRILSEMVYLERLILGFSSHFELISEEIKNISEPFRSLV